MTDRALNLIKFLRACSCVHARSCMHAAADPRGPEVRIFSFLLRSDNCNRQLVKKLIFIAFLKKHFKTKAVREKLLTLKTMLKILIPGPPKFKLGALPPQ